MKVLPESRESKQRVSVKIYGEEYLVKGSASREYITMLASYVDQRMRQLENRNPRLSPSKVAVLTALNLADELMKLQEDYDNLVKLLGDERTLPIK
ncbi:MAG: cell division protein ZapA [Firmicutes bacterium]|nr:cell division protein ZapA [Bacillota bacterium]